MLKRVCYMNEEIIISLKKEYFFLLLDHFFKIKLNLKKDVYLRLFTTINHILLVLKSYKSVMI